MRQRSVAGCPGRTILQKCSGYTRSGRRRLPGERRVLHYRSEAQLCRPLGRSFEGQAVTRDQLERSRARTPGLRASAFRLWCRRDASRTCRRADSGMRSQSRERSSRARTSRAVEGSGTHGPEPIEARSSPMTSETTYTRTEAGASARASRPPPQRENRFRIRFIAVMSRPDAEQQGVELGELRRRDALHRCAQQAGGAAGEQHPDLLARSGLGRDCPRASAAAREPGPGSGWSPANDREPGWGAGAGAGGTINPPAGSGPRSRPAAPPRPGPSAGPPCRAR